MHVSERAAHTHARTHTHAHTHTHTRTHAYGAADNALNGVPACASAFLAGVLRDAWGFSGYVTSDTDAVANIFDPHHYTDSYEAAACAAITDGRTDINSGGTYWEHLGNATGRGLCGMGAVDAALSRALGVQFDLGMFDPIEDQPYWKVWGVRRVSRDVLWLRDLRLPGTGLRVRARAGE